MNPIFLLILAIASCKTAFGVEDGARDLVAVRVPDKIHFYRQRDMSIHELHGIRCKNCGPDGKMPVDELACTVTEGDWKCYSVPNAVVALWSHDMNVDLTIEVSEKWLSEGDAYDACSESRDLVAQRERGQVFSRAGTEYWLRCENCKRQQDSPVDELTCITTTDGSWQCDSVPATVIALRVENGRSSFFPSRLKEALLVEASEAWLVKKESEKGPTEKCEDCLRPFCTLVDELGNPAMMPFRAFGYCWPMPTPCEEVCREYCGN